jgi:hypothetical protein
MPDRVDRLLLLLFALFFAPQTSAFRSCEVEYTDAYLAATRYVVTEITFDPTTGLASGTETTYNHTNSGPEGHHECHVTYELSGILEPASGAAVLTGRRTNHSVSCRPDFIAAGYPQERLYALQIELAADGKTRVELADSGELLAYGDWSAGATVFRTEETCTAF